jgi:hypothetical protein
MRYQRKIGEKTKRDKIRNQIITLRLGITSLREMVESAQLRWFGHVRLEDER